MAPGHRHHSTATKGEVSSGDGRMATGETSIEDRGGREGANGASVAEVDNPARSVTAKCDQSMQIVSAAFSGFIGQVAMQMRRVLVY